MNHCEAYDNVEFLDSVRDREQLMEQLMSEGDDIPPYTAVTVTKTHLCEAISRQIDKLKTKDAKEGGKASGNHHHPHVKKP